MENYPVIIPRSEHPVSRRSLNPNALRVLYQLKKEGYLAYVAGGAIRDLLLGRPPKDVDIVTDATPNQVKRVFRNCRLIGRRFRLAHIHFGNDIIEVATFRRGDVGGDAKENGPAELPAPAGAAEHPPALLKAEDGRILRDNVFGTPEQDACRRDFTINALFYNIADFTIIDYIGGLPDIHQRVIRSIGDPWLRFTEDPVRLVRAVRFAAMLKFTIEPMTLQALLECREGIIRASADRMYEEIHKLLLLGAGERTVHMLMETGLFDLIFPIYQSRLGPLSATCHKKWILNATRWVDAQVQRGLPPPPQLLYAVMFGQLIQARAIELGATGHQPMIALIAAVGEFLADFSTTVRIPGKVSIALRHILWNQTRFRKTRNRSAQTFAKSVEFAEAWAYFCFINDQTGENTELRAWWTAFLNEAVPIPPTGSRESPPGSGRRRRRRRGGRHRGKETGQV